MFGTPIRSYNTIYILLASTVQATGIAVNYVQYGGFPRKIHAKNLRVNFYTSFYAQTFYKQIWVFFLRWLIFLVKIHASCVYSKCSWYKLETDILEKCLFAVKKKTTYCTVSLTMIMLRSQTSCFVINNFLGYCLKRYFTCKLGCMLLAMTVVLKSVQCFSLCSRHSDSRARTSVHCFFQFRLVYNTWFELSRVKL